MFSGDTLLVLGLMVMLFLLWQGVRYPKESIYVGDLDRLMREKCEDLTVITDVDTGMPGESVTTQLRTTDMQVSYTQLGTDDVEIFDVSLRHLSGVVVHLEHGLLRRVIYWTGDQYDASSLSNHELIAVESFVGQVRQLVSHSSEQSRSLQ